MTCGAKPDNPSLIPRIYMVEKKKRNRLQSLGSRNIFYEKSSFVRIELTPTCCPLPSTPVLLCVYIHTYVHTHENINVIERHDFQQTLVRYVLPFSYDFDEV